MTDAKGFMKLNDDELKWLEGRIGIFDVQKGCPVQCLTCGVDSPKYAGSMPWHDFMEISDSIMDVASLKDIDIFISGFHREIYPFQFSDPIYYHSMDGAIERTIYDVMKVLHSSHDVHNLFTTSGWTPGNNYMQRSIERIVESRLDESSLLGFMFSFKTVSERAMKEYDRFIVADKNSNVRKNHKRIDQRFIEESVFSRHLQDNIRTLSAMGPIYSMQYISDDDLNKKGFKERYGDYRTLFSKSFVESLYNHCFDTDYLARMQLRSSRNFIASGKAAALGLEKDESYSRNLKDIATGRRIDPLDSNYCAMITGHGTIQILYGCYDDISQISVPKEHFQIMAQQNKSSRKMYNRYMMLANLQGKSLID